MLYLQPGETLNEISNGMQITFCRAIRTTYNRKLFFFFSFRFAHPISFDIHVFLIGVQIYYLGCKQILLPRRNVVLCHCCIRRNWIR